MEPKGVHFCVHEISNPSPEAGESSPQLANLFP